MHSAVQTAVVTIPLSGLNFARYTGQYGSYMPSSPLEVYKPLVLFIRISFPVCENETMQFEGFSYNHYYNSYPIK